MRFAFILNPAAKHGLARKQHERLAQACHRTGLTAEIRLTEAPGHAERLAYEAAATADAVVAVGGDGTIHEVSAGLIAHGGGVPMGLLPQGTGNDFAKMFALPATLEAGVARLAHAAPVPVDYGEVTWAAEGQTHTSVFVNAVGIGFDAQAAHAAQAFKRLPGSTLAYLAAVLQTLRHWASPAVQLFDDEAPNAQPRFAGKMFLLCVSNGVSSGGGFYLTPEARLDDGLLDACLITDATRARALRMLPSVLKGRHVTAPEVRMHRTTTLHLTTDRPLPLHADGEMLTLAATALTVRIVPGGLQVLAPVRQ